MAKEYIELKEMSDGDLQSELKQINSQYQKLRFDHTIKGLDNPVNLRNTKRDIAPHSNRNPSPGSRCNDTCPGSKKI
jgi:ribosomal protein L29